MNITDASYVDDSAEKLKYEGYYKQCPLHPGEVVNYICCCITCDQSEMGCTECMLESHLQHKQETVNVDAFFQKKRLYLSKVILVPPTIENLEKQPNSKDVLDKKINEFTTTLNQQSDQFCQTIKGIQQKFDQIRSSSDQTLHCVDCLYYEINDLFKRIAEIDRNKRQQENIQIQGQSITKQKLYDMIDKLQMTIADMVNPFFVVLEDLMKDKVQVEVIVVDEDDVIKLKARMFYNLICTTLELHKDWVTYATFCKNGRLFASCSQDSQLFIYNTENQKRVVKFQGALGKNHYFFKCQFYQMDQRIIFGVDDNTVMIYDIEKGLIVQKFVAHDIMMYTLSLDGEQKYLLTGGNESIKIWDCVTLKSIKEIKQAGCSIIFIQWFPNNNKFVTVSDKREIKTWSSKTYNVLSKCKNLVNYNWGCDCISFSSNSKYLAIAGPSKSVSILKTKELAPHNQLQNCHEFEVSCVQYLQNGDQLVSGDVEGVIKLWDLQTKEIIQQLLGHSGKIRSIIFRFDELQMITASDDTTIKIWEFTKK